MERAISKLERSVRFPDCCVALLSKAPVLGRVKTRIACDCGEEAALRLHCALFRHVMAMLCSARLCAFELWTDAPHAFFDDFGGPLRIQPSGTLGLRLAHIARSVLSRYRYVLLIGGDCCDLDAAYLRSAIRILHDGHDAVIGPAVDGGYVLLGLRRYSPELFRDIDWGGPQVLAQTRERLVKLSWRWRELPALLDIDTVDDLKVYGGLDALLSHLEATCSDFKTFLK